MAYLVKRQRLEVDLVGSQIIRSPPLRVAGRWTQLVPGFDQILDGDLHSSGVRGGGIDADGDVHRTTGSGVALWMRDQIDSVRLTGEGEGTRFDPLCTCR